MSDPTITEGVASPLASDRPDTITELFARDCSAGVPWNDADMTRMIEHLRSERARLGENQRPVKAATKQLEGKTGADVLSLLGLSEPNT